MSVEPSHFKLQVDSILPPHELVAQGPSTALSTAAETLPATIPAMPRLSFADYALPATAGSAWLTSLGLAFSQGASLPLLAALTAAGVGSSIALVRNLVARKAIAPTTADAAMTRTHFNYATDPLNAAKLRVEHAHKYVRASATIPGDEAERLLKDLPRGQEWGIVRGPFGNGPTRFQSVLAGIGLRAWGQFRWVPYDVELVVTGLAKLGPVTPQQRASIERSALDIMGNYYDRHETLDELQADLIAGVRELVRRAPGLGEA